MSVTRDHGKVSFECDECGETFETNTQEFYEALEQAKQEGWRAVRTSKGWKHFCKNC